MLSELFAALLLKDGSGAVTDVYVGVAGAPNDGVCEERGAVAERKAVGGTKRGKDAGLDGDLLLGDEQDGIAVVEVTAPEDCASGFLLRSAGNQPP